LNGTVVALAVWVAATVALAPAAADAHPRSSPVAYHHDDRDGDGGNGSGNDCQSGGCGNDQQNDDSYGQCKYVCPTFDKSPVDHSFNLTVCVMPGSCPAPQSPPPQKAAGPGCLVFVPWHCDPHPNQKGS
jgi:hypothetical protein